MRVTRLSVRNFRSYEAAEVRLGPGLTVVTGPNGAGKTNLLEAVYFACTGRSCRTGNEREVVRFGAGVARLELDAERDGDAHRITVGFEPGEAKRLQVDGATVDKLTDSSARPLVSVFLPDRLDLVLGAPTLRRAHVDQVIAALWPARVGTRRAYTAALAQRNALLGAIRAGRAGRSSLPAWDLELARHGVALAADRAAVVSAAGGAVRDPRGGARARGRRRAELPAALARRDRRGAGRRAGGAHRLGPRPRLHRPRAAPRRAGAQARRPRAAHLRVARPAAPRAALAAARRARCPGGGAWRRSADAARRRHLRARLAAPRAARRGAARGRRAERHRDHGPRARARRRRARGRAAVGGRGQRHGRGAWREADALPARSPRRSTASPPRSPPRPCSPRSSGPGRRPPERRSRAPRSRSPSATERSPWRAPRRSGRRSSTCSPNASSSA